MPFELTIVTPEGPSYKGTVERVVLPGSAGEFGVLSSHERFLSSLKVGEIEISTPDGPLWAAITGGFAEVNGDQVTVLVDACALEHEIDAARADTEYTEAQQALASIAGEDNPERYAHFEAALEHAKARAAVSNRKRP